MFKNNDYNVNRHSNSKLKFVLGVQVYNEIKAINNEIQKDLIKLIEKNFSQHHKCHIENIEIEDESSIKIYFEAPMNLILPNIISNFKTVSSRFMKKKYEKELIELSLNEKFWDSKYYLRTREA